MQFQSVHKVLDHSIWRLHDNELHLSELHVLLKFCVLIE